MCPESFESFRESHIVKRAAALGAASFEVVDIRDFAEGSFRAVCDSPFGGGRGLLLRAEPVFQALQAALSGEKRDSEPGGSGQPAPENVPGAVAGPGEKNAADAGIRVVFLMPGGRTFSQGIAREYAARGITVNAAAPGFIDQHVHGGFGVSVLRASPEETLGWLEFLLKNVMG